jgi:hypothetical protein
VFAALGDVYAVATGLAGAAVFFALLYVAGRSGNNDRAREHEAREFFSEHGRWPDE